LSKILNSQGLNKIHLAIFQIFLVSKFNVMIMTTMRKVKMNHLL
jgi:hypothetical protein